MSVLFIALPVCLLISVISVTVFAYLVWTGQFDDLETPPRRMLFDDSAIDGNRDLDDE